MSCLKIIFVISSLLLFSCYRETLKPLPLSEKLQANRDRALAPLQEMAQRKLTLSFDSSCLTPQIAGHQYLLIALPFGRLEITPSEWLRPALKEALLLQGTLVNFTENTAPVITCPVIQTTAYDFIFVRRLSVSLQACFSSICYTEHEGTLAVSGFASDFSPLIKKMSVRLAKKLVRTILQQQE